MNSQHSQIRSLVVAVAAAALALVAAGPAGAWADPPGGRQDGNGMGSIPPPEVQRQLERRAAITSNLVHEGVQADRRLGTVVAASEVAGVVGAMNPGVVVRDGRTFVPAVATDGSSTLVEIGRARVADASAAGTVVGAMNPGVVVRDGRTFVPGVAADGSSALVEIGTGASTSSALSHGDRFAASDLASTGLSSGPPATRVTVVDEGFEWSPTALGITAAIAAALLMAATMVGMTHGRRRRMASV